MACKPHHLPPVSRALRALGLEINHDETKMTDIFVSTISLCMTVGIMGYVLWMALNLPDDIGDF